MRRKSGETINQGGGEKTLNHQRRHVRTRENFDETLDNIKYYENFNYHKIKYPTIIERKAHLN